MGLIFLVDLRGNIEDYKIKLYSELEGHGWYKLEEVEALKTIGPDSPTGTLGQLKRMVHR